jgi:pimeloyl-ACP methyl ester carboxylesterase
MLDGVSQRRVAASSPGLELALLDWGGDGPLALLHHATGFCAALWAPVAERLRPHFRVVAMDARGHGGSSKPEAGDAYDWEHFGRDAEAVAAQLAEAHGPVALGIGHSMGGAALLLAAVARPELFERLVLVDPIVASATLVLRDRSHAEQASGMVEAARRRRAVWESRDEARAKWSSKEMFAGWDPRVFALYLDHALADRPDGRVELECPAEVEAAIFQRAPELDAMSRAGSLEVPTLVLWARRGNFPRAHFEALAARMRDGCVRDADAGHLVPMEAPALVAAEALAFSAPPGSPGASSRSSPRGARSPV